jgi:hypothetical protein
MEGMECLSLTEDDLDDDPVLSYTSAQLCHHEAAQVHLTNLPPTGAERLICSCWHQNELFHVSIILWLDA